MGRQGLGNCAFAWNAQGNAWIGLKETGAALGSIAWHWPHNAVANPISELLVSKRIHVYPYAQAVQPLVYHTSATGQ